MGPLRLPFIDVPEYLVKKSIAGMTNKQLDRVFIVCDSCDRVIGRTEGERHVCNPDVTAD
jgi:hypothetical protein